jgi:hypothetical protein
MNDDWIGISDLARATQRDISSVSRQITLLEARSLVATRTAGCAKEVALREFERATGESIDRSRLEHHGVLRFAPSSFGNEP